MDRGKNLSFTELVIGRSERQLDSLSADDILRALCKDVDIEDVAYLLQEIAYLLQEIASEKNPESIIVSGEDIKEELSTTSKFYLK